MAGPRDPGDGPGSGGNKGLRSRESSATAGHADDTNVELTQTSTTSPLPDKETSSTSIPEPSASSKANGKESEEEMTTATATETKTKKKSRKGEKKPPQPDKPTAPVMAVDVPELDDFGLPVPRYSSPSRVASGGDGAERSSTRSRSNTSQQSQRSRRDSARVTTAPPPPRLPEPDPTPATIRRGDAGTDSDEDDFKDAVAVLSPVGEGPDGPKTPVPLQSQLTPKMATMPKDDEKIEEGAKAKEEPAVTDDGRTKTRSATLDSTKSQSDAGKEKVDEELSGKKKEGDHSRQPSLASTVTTNGVSEFSHQHVLNKKEEKDDDDGGWQEMPSYARYDMYNDDDKLVAKEHDFEEDEKYQYAGLGGAGKGYTRVVVDDDAESATSMDENTQYLFKDIKSTSMMDDDDETRDAISQMQATKDLLTEGQRIAYVGVTRLELLGIVKKAENMEQTRRTKKLIAMAAESTKMWAQKMMIRLYSHMEISAAEQLMIEQLGEHGVRSEDLTPVLVANARVKNPMAENSVAEDKEPRKSTSSGGKSPRPPASPVPPEEEKAAEPPPAYEETEGKDMPDVKMPSQLPSSSKLDIDIRWTVLCDLFLLLVADSVYDARSRLLLERVAESLGIPWIDICRFEKRVTDALEMQQAAEKENWNEDVHMEARRRLALKRRYVMMGLATVGGGLVIGLSAGLLAPLIGGGLAAGFTYIGVSGTSTFLAGAGGAAVITSGAAASGSIIGGRAANRRTGAVKTFEYRPLHNNKRVNLIITVSGWMTGKVDDVRLPYSTVDSIMGDIYSVLWEPDMLRSMGDTINILATEALTQGVQQVLGSTILMALMSALQLPIVLTKLSYLIDNPWAVSLDRATSAGLILADSLIDRNLGTRPITLVGYSLGARVIFSCLQELARKGAVGLVQNVYLFGSPVVVKKDEFLRARAVVAGRFVNAYNRSDWILGYLFRLTNGGIRRVAGLAAIDDIPLLENLDVTELVPGHMAYRTQMPRLLRECGWLVESDEFTEIEDPDPENHGERQRELINEIEEARKELEKEGKATKGGAFSSFFRKKKGLEKAEWEIYQDSNKEGGGGGANQKTGAADDDKDGSSTASPGSGGGVLFDVDAIRAELAKERLEVRELQSTLPPMRLDLSAGSSPGPATPKPPATVTPLRSRSPLHDTFTGGVGGSDGMAVAVEPTTTSSLSAKTVHHQQQQRHLSPSPSPRPSPLASPLPPDDWRSLKPEPEPEEVQMTFDTDFREDNALPPKSARTPTTMPFRSSSAALPSTGAAHAPPPPPKNESLRSSSVAAYDRPGMHGAKTSPAAARNPWADDDDDVDFGKEQEITMTFA